MKHRARVLLCAILAGGCPRTQEPSESHEADANHHEHEERHDELPRVVGLSDQVIREAGIVTEAVQRRTLAPTVRLPGEIVADPNREASVAARVEGIVEAIHVTPGDSVEQGEVLATIRAPDIQSLRAAEAALQAKASAARANADRIAALVPRRMASQQEEAAAKAEASALEAEARAAREKLRALGIRGNGRRAITYDLRAPIDGVILNRPVAAGAPVTAETVVATMVSTDRVWFVAHVFERDVARVDVGSKASIRLNAYPDQAFDGRVEYVSHQVDPGARTLSVRIPLANPDGKLRLGLFGTAHVEASGEASDPVIAAPNSALTRIQGQPVVFVRHADGDFELHEVVLGISDTDHTEIVHGLREGELVVSRGAFTVKSALLRGTFGEDPH